MRFSTKDVGKKKQPVHKDVARAASFSLEPMEQRFLLSSTIAAWKLDTLAVSSATITGITSVTATTGLGTAYSIGMQNSTANGYLYPAAGIAATADTSNLLQATGNSDSGGNGGSEGGTNGYVWRIQAGQSQAAPIASQGLQLDASTSGHTGISVQFDLAPSSTGAPAQFAVEYTTDVQDGTNATWTNVTGSLTFGPNDTANTQGVVPSIGNNPSNSVYIQNNAGGANANIISGAYATITGPNPSGTNTSWLNDLVVNLGSLADNSPNFGFRVVNAATGSSETSITGASTLKNWRFNDMAVTASDGATAAPSITLNPVNQAVGAGTNVTMTAAATGSPTPSVHWYVSVSGGTFTPDTTDSGNQSNTLILPNTNTGESGNRYEAVYSNSLGTVTTSPATLTVASSPVILSQPASQTVKAGSNVTLLASAIGAPNPSVQWYVSSNGGTFAAIAGANTTYLNVTANEATTGNQYEAVFTNTNGTATTNSATLTVIGTPIAQWDFTSGQAASPGGNTSAGTANSPLPTSQINSGNSVSILGLKNSYDGVPAYPEADIIPLASSVDPGIQDYVWRVRSGSGLGPTGSPGNPDGWSQNAPPNTQGVDYTVNTTTFSNITLNFDLLQGSIGDIQPQYYNGSTWVNIGTPIQSIGKDYYGVSAPTALSAAATLTADTSATISVSSSSGFYFDQNITIGGISAVVTGVGAGSLTVFPSASGTAASGAQVIATPDPTGVSVNLQGIAYANNNPALQVRLVSVYDPALPNIVDGNPAVPTGAHGQYASGFGQANDIQVIDLDNFVSSGGASSAADGQNFTLTFAGQTTSTITYSSNATTMAANIQAALQALPNIGSGNVSVASTIALNNYTPPGPITAYNGFSVIFGGTLAHTAEPTITISDSNDNVSTWQNGTPSTITTTLSSAFTLTATQPVTLSVGSTANFTVGNPIVVGNVTALITAVGTGTLTVTPEISGSVQSGTTVQQLGATGFVDGGGSIEMGNISFNGDQTNGAPGIVTNPVSQTAAAGYPVTFSATAYSETVPTVSWQVFSNGTWATVSSGTVTPTGGTFTASSNNQYTSTYTFTTDANSDQNGYQYRAVFNNGLATPSGAATLTVVSPQSPYVLIQPTNESVQEGQQTFFSAMATGSPTPSVQWQSLAPGASTWTSLTDNASTISGAKSNTLTVITSNDQTENGTEYRAVYSSNAGTTTTNAVTMTVLPTESILTDWDFSAPQYASALSADSFVQSPAPVPAGTDNSLDVGGTATPLGMNLPYNPADPATGTGAPGAVDAEDITNSSGGVIDTNFTGENTWRVRSGINSNPASAGAPANGWSNFVAPSTQGAEFAVPTTGYSNVYVTLDWFATHSGEQDAQRQYSLDGGQTWQNLGSQIQLYAPGNDDWYGDSSIGAVAPVVFDLTGVSGAGNNPNLAVRLVNSYNLVLSNQQNILLNDSSNFTLTFNGQTTGTIAYSPSQSTMTANIQTALAALPNVGANNLSVTYNSSSGAYTVQFMGALGTSIQPVMTITTTTHQDTVTQQNQYANAQLSVNGNPFTAVPYNGSKGNWRLDNITFHGTAITPPALVSTSFVDYQPSTSSWVSVGAQRSSFEGVELKFNEPINLTTSDFTMNYETVADNENFTNGVAGSQTFNAISSGNIALTSPDGGTTWILTPTLGSSFDRTGGAGNFATGGTGTYGDGYGVWGNGVYQVVLNGSEITANGQSLNGGQAYTAQFTDGTGAAYSEFASLYGDTAGQEFVDATAYKQFKQSYEAQYGDSNYIVGMDSNGDSIVDGTDLKAFKQDYEVQLTLE